jgi:hypothetical protein
LLKAPPSHHVILGEDREYALCDPGFIPEPSILEVFQNYEEVLLVELTLFISKVQIKSDILNYLIDTGLQTLIPFGFIKASVLKLAHGGHFLPRARPRLLKLFAIKFFDAAIARILPGMEPLHGYLAALPGDLRDEGAPFVQFRVISRVSRLLQLLELFYALIIELLVDIRAVCTSDTCKVLGLTEVIGGAADETPISLSLSELILLSQLRQVVF